LANRRAKKGEETRTRREKGSETTGRSLGGEESGKAKRRHKTRDDDEDLGQRNQWGDGQKGETGETKEQDSL